MNGNTAEDFTLKDQEGNEFNLYKNLDKKVLLVFFPKDDSTVCTKQLLNYSRFINEFEKLGVKVIGVNTGDCSSHKHFCKSKGIEIKLLCDETKTISKRFSALNLFGINKRKVVLIGTDRKIIIEKSTLPINYLNAERLLEFIKAGVK